jgi:Type I phosphodiesterase / nucleotide pyrophosphatase
VGAADRRADTNPGSKRLVALVACIALLAVGTAWYFLQRDEGDAPFVSSRDLAAEVLQRACRLEPAYLERIVRGHHPVRSEDVTIVPREPNFVGSFDLTSHSGPWDYLQRVPLIVYGPNRVAARGEIDTPATMRDIYPTVGRLLDVDLEQRGGRVLDESLLGDKEGIPRLIVVVVWDGAGRVTLEQWADRWPNLKRMVEQGTSYANATVGTSPSVTSAVHSTLSTGAYPAVHGITGNELRVDGDRVIEPFTELKTDSLEVSTFADQVDAEFDNRSRVGMLAWVKWHLGMLGHGTSYAGGDGDELGLIHYNQGIEIRSGTDFEDVQEISSASDISQLIDTLDRDDGAVDGKWLGNDIALPEGGGSWITYSNPAWAHLQAELAIAMLSNGEYGKDAVPDIFLANFKATDLAGHRWGIDAAEMGEVVEAQDAALGSVIDYLDREVSDYAVILTADHGTSPLARDSGAWPIDQRELIKDVDAHFEVAEGRTVIEASSAFGYYLDRVTTRELAVSPEEISDFLNDYTIAQNWPEDALPKGYEQRGDEQVLSAAFPSDDIEEILDCAVSR